MQGPDFASIKRRNVYDMEYWSARDLQPLLGYESSWQNFEGVIKKAMIAATAPDLKARPEDHCSKIEEDVRRGRKGRGTARRRKNYLLSKLACRLIAQCSDPRKDEIKAAMHYLSFTADFYERAVSITKL